MFDAFENFIQVLTFCINSCNLRILLYCFTEINSYVSITCTYPSQVTIEKIYKDLHLILFHLCMVSEKDKSPNLVVSA